MNITLEKTGDLTAEVLVHLEAADYKRQVKDELKKHAKTLKMPGFRPGKVPIGMVRKMAGIGLVIDEVQKVVNENLSQYFADEKINVLGDPLPTEIKDESDFDLYCESDMDFRFELGIAPEFEIDFAFEGIPAKYEIEIDDAYLEEEIRKLQDRFADVEQPETVDAGDVIFGKLFEVDEAGEAVEEGFEQSIPLNPDRIEDESLFEPFLGKSVGEVLPFDLFAIGEDHAAIARLTYIDEEDLEDLQEKQFHYEIKRLNRTTPAKLEKEFFDKVAGNFGWEAREEEEEWDEASFREKLRESHAEEIKELESQRFHGDIYKALIDAHEHLDFPAEFLKKWMGSISEDKSEEEIEEEFPDFKRGLIWSLITEKLQKANEDLNVTPEEVTESIQAYVRQTFAYSGQSISREQEAEYMMRLLQNKEIVNQHYSRLSSGKIFPFIEQEVDPARQPITATDFFQMIEEEREAEEAKKAAAESAKE